MLSFAAKSLRHAILALVALALLAEFGTAEDEPRCDRAYERIYQARAEENMCVSTTLGDTVCHRINKGSKRVIFFTSDPLYYGWRTFKTYCHACHAERSKGTEGNIANLIHLYGNANPPPDNQSRFTTYVLHGKESLNGDLAMPPWRSYPHVTRRIDAIYAYIRARGECKLPYLEHWRLKRCGQWECKSADAHLPSASSD